jgi:hypothetical protein
LGLAVKGKKTARGVDSTRRLVRTLIYAA